jgi:hypothetical protein
MVYLFRIISNAEMSAVWYAIHQLDRVFNLRIRAIRVQARRPLLSDDAKNNHLIFVGSPSEDLTLLDIPGTEELVFRRLDSGPRKGDLAVLDLAVQNVHPLAGEPKTFLATPANQPTTEDYAVVSLRGPRPITSS